MDDFLFLGCCYLSGIDSQSYTVLFPKVAQDGLLIGGSRVFTERPDTPIGVAADEMVRIKLDDARRDHVKEVLNFRFRS